MDTSSLAAAVRPTRRAALAILGASTVAVGLAACSPITNNGQSTGGVQPTKDAAGAETLPLAKVPLGASVAATVNGQPVILSQPTAGKVAAFSAICTHEGCVIAPASGLEADCPCHGSKFDTATGKVLHGPANQPLDAVKATVSGGTITFPA